MKLYSVPKVQQGMLAAREGSRWEWVLREGEAPTSITQVRLDDARSGVLRSADALLRSPCADGRIFLQTPSWIHCPGVPYLEKC